MLVKQNAVGFFLPKIRILKNEANCGSAHVNLIGTDYHKKKSNYRKLQ